MYHINYSGLQDNPVIEYEILTAETLGEVETVALLECRKHFKSKFIMLHHIGELVYAVYDGLNEVGTLKIRSL